MPEQPENEDLSVTDLLRLAVHLLEHGEPERGHQGACSPMATPCDGACSEYASYMRSRRRFLDGAKKALRRPGINNYIQAEKASLSAAKFLRFANALGVDVDEEEAKKLLNAWKKEFPEMRQFWRSMKKKQESVTCSLHGDPIPCATCAAQQRGG